MWGLRTEMTTTLKATKHTGLQSLTQLTPEYGAFGTEIGTDL